MLCTPNPPTVSEYFRGFRRSIGWRWVKECGSSIKHLVRKARLTGLANLRALLYLKTAGMHVSVCVYTDSGAATLDGRMQNDRLT